MTASPEPTSRGHLNPGAPNVHFDRFELGPDLREVVRHVWLVRWSLPSGFVQRQRVLAYPAFNIVFEPGAGSAASGPHGPGAGSAASGPHGPGAGSAASGPHVPGAGSAGSGPRAAGDCSLYPPLPHVQIRELEGTSWGVGLLLRPGSGILFSPKPSAVPAAGERLPDAPAARVSDQLAPWSADSRGTLVSVLRGWLAPLACRVDDVARLVNSACDIAENDRDLLRAGDLADAVSVTPRTLERAVRDRLGVTPKWLIECRRMQEAATTLFAEPDTDVSALAADLGFTDYPHFARNYRRIIGETPKQTAIAADDG